MRFDRARRAALAVGVLVLAGCATSRSELKIEAPKTPVAVKPGAPVIVIRTITDSRVFEENPKTPDIPSLGGEGAAQATAEVKARAVGRKRNTYGKGLGDVLLDNGQAVAGVVRDNLAAAFGEAGFAVKPDAAAAGAMTVDVTIRKLWAWVQPGFTEITLHMDIDVDLAFSGKGGKKVISVRATDGRLAAGEDAWREIIEKGFVEFRKQSTVATRALPR